MYRSGRHHVESSRKDKVAFVLPIWGKADVRQTPLSTLKRFPSEVASPFRQIALRSIQLERPRFGKLPKVIGMCLRLQKD